MMSDRGETVYDFDKLYPRLNIGAAKWQPMQQDGADNLPMDVFPFSVADMDFKIAPEIQESLHQLADFGIFGYMQLTERYYQAVCGWMERRHRAKIAPEWIVQVPGIVPALFQLVRAFSEPGEGVIIQTPVYGPFSMAVERQGRRLVRNPLLQDNGRYRMDFADLAAKAADPGTRLMILCSPHNPVGRVWSREELETVARICLDNQVMLISDEIHADLIYEPYCHTMMTNLSEEISSNLAICTAPSKTFNLAGLATANLIIPNAAHRKHYQDTVANAGGNMANTMGTSACIAAYESGDPWYRALMKYLTGNRELYGCFMREHLPELQTLPPEGTYLAWFDARPLGLTPDALTRLMRNARMYLGEGIWFGEEGLGYQRLNFALPRQALEAGLLRLKQAIRSL